MIRGVWFWNILESVERYSMVGYGIRATYIRVSPTSRL